MELKINIPFHVAFIIDKLENSGFEAYIVGGCVRDSIMGKVPHDWDICTSALPEQVISVFRDYKVSSTGLRHGTVTVVIEYIPYEITTYRIEGEYRDNRRPGKVEFVLNLESDIKRRDFTVNAMAYNHKRGLIDLYSGVRDIENKKIKCVGNPCDRLQEDSLRILRAIRFAVRFGFRIEDETFDAMKNNKYLLKNISAERVSSELTEILANLKFVDENKDCPGTKCSYNNTYSSMVIEFIRAVVPDNFNIDYDKAEFNLYNSFPSVELRLAIIFDNPHIKDILKKLRFSTKIINTAVTVRKYGYKILAEIDIWAAEGNINKPYYARKLLNKIKLNLVRLAIEFAKSQSRNNDELSTLLEYLYFNVSKCALNKDVCSLSALALNGSDLIRLGYKGNQVGLILNVLLDMVMQDKVLNIKEDLIKSISNISFLAEKTKK